MKDYKYYKQKLRVKDNKPGSLLNAYHKKHKIGAGINAGKLQSIPNARLNGPSGVKPIPNPSMGGSGIKALKRKGIKKGGSFAGKSNALGHGGRAAQLRARGVPGGVIGELARRAHAAPGQRNYHGKKGVKHKGFQEGFDTFLQRAAPAARAVRNVTSLGTIPAAQGLYHGFQNMMKPANQIGQNIATHNNAVKEALNYKRKKK